MSFQFHDTQTKKTDSGLNCFVLFARLEGISVDAEQIIHAYGIGPDGMTTPDILRVAKDLGFKAKSAQADYQKLLQLRHPVIANCKSGYIVLVKIQQEKAIILDPSETNPKTIKKEEFLSQWGKEIILLSFRGRNTLNKEFNLKWFLPAVWKYRKPFTEVLMASFILQLFGLITPIFTQVVIDKVLVHQSIPTLDVLVIGLAAIAGFEMILGIARTHIFNHTTSKLDVMLGARVFRHLFTLPLRYFEVRRVGDTISRVREIEHIRQFLTGAPLTAALDGMFVILFIVVMFFYSSTLTLVTIGILPLFAGLAAFVIPLLKHRLDERFDKGAEMQSYLVEAVSGVQTVKSLAMEPLMQKKWENLIAGYISASFKVSHLAGIAGSAGQFLQRASYLSILWLGAHLVISGKLTVGQLIAFQMMANRVIDPVLRLVQMWQDFQQTGLSIERLGDILNVKSGQVIKSAQTRLPAIEGRICAENVRFRYRVDASEVLRNVSFVVEPGALIGIVGRSGSGKSTLSRLIQRLYVPESGRILIDGTDISTADPAWLRRQIGVVLQENFLFNGTVRDNIAIHYPSADIKEIVRVSQLAGAHEFILELPEGYDTITGEKGTCLSGGQRQRIAIARALLTNPKILIFDEATSALDYESERIIQRNLQEICIGRTVLIIAHRLSTIRHANKILVIEKGDLVESGAHSELIERKGLYYHLYNQQEIGL